VTVSAQTVLTTLAQFVTVVDQGWGLQTTAARRGGELLPRRPVGLNPSPILPMSLVA
jgi:hypothetical protein